jgi:hypothetical protein
MQNASLNTLCRTRRFLQPCKIRRKNKARDTHYILVLRDRIPTDSLMHPLIGDSHQELGDAVDGVLMAMPFTVIISSPGYRF